MKINLEVAWNKISEKYQKYTKISLSDVHYGPLSHGEKKLKLLGNVNGKKILEVGCGGGQNSIVLSKWGAKVSGVDLSSMQISYAKSLALKERVNVDFHVVDANRLSKIFKKKEFDIVISSYVFHYTKDLKKVFSEISKVLSKNGIFVFCSAHPLCYHKITKSDIFVKNYFNPKASVWYWEYPDGIKEKFLDFYHTIEDYFHALESNGFVVETLIEQKALPREKIKESPYIAEDYLREINIWQKIPHTLLIKARKIK